MLTNQQHISNSTALLPWSDRYKIIVCITTSGSSENVVCKLKILQHTSRIYDYNQSKVTSWRILAIYVWIPTCLKNRKWKYRTTKNNPADLFTREISTSQFRNSDLWFHGPTWLTIPGEMAIMASKRCYHGNDYRTRNHSRRYIITNEQQ